jgi:excisionase family DNA binding protein
MEKRLLSVAETAELLGISQSFLYKLAESESIPHIRLGRAIRFDIRQIDVWLEGIVSDEINYADKLPRKQK